MLFKFVDDPAQNLALNMINTASRSIAQGIEATLNLMTDPDRDRRETGALELARVFGENIRTFARVHNTCAKEKEVIDRWRQMPTAQTGRHLANHVEPEVVEALRDFLGGQTSHA